jgi:hypothetical protein
MGKTFREGYYEEDDLGNHKNNRNNKQTRHKVKDYLRNIDFEDLDEDEELDFENLM